MKYDIIFTALYLALLFSSCQSDHPASLQSNILGDTSIHVKEKQLDNLLHSLAFKRNDSFTRKAYLDIASGYYYLNHSKKSLSVCLQAFKLSEQANDTLRMAKAADYAGDCFENTARDSAYYYYLKAEKLYYVIKDKDNIGKVLFNKAYVLFYDGNYVECEIETSKALKNLSGSKKHQLLYSCYTLLGNCLEKEQQYDESLHYHQLALKELKVMKALHKDEDQLNNYNVSSIINICNLYDLKGEYKKSINELSKLLTPHLKNKWPALYANVLSNLAYSKMKIGDLKKVKLMFNTSLSMVTKLGLKPDILYKKIHLGELFLLQKDTLQSIRMLNEAQHLATEINSSNELLTTLLLLSKIDKKNEIAHAYRYINVSDSLTVLQRKAHDKYARIAYDTSRIEQENGQLLKSKTLILVFSIISILLLVIFLLATYFRYKHKKFHFFMKQHESDERVYQLLAEHQEKIYLARENEKTKISQELHDGVMNRIYGVRMNLGFFNAKNTPEVIEKRKVYIHDLEHIENEIRCISHDLKHKSLLLTDDFYTLLVDLLEKQNPGNKLNFKYELDDNLDWKYVEYIFRINIHRIIQEAVLNIYKHANASTCLISIKKEGNNRVTLTITDNGKGFDVKKTHALAGIGLRNIMDRAKLLHGDIKIESSPNIGTTVQVSILLADSFHPLTP